MSRVTKSFKASSIAELVADVNAYLAPFVGGSSRDVIWADMKLILYPRQLTTVLEFIITTDTVPTGPATTPFVLAILQEGNVTDLDAAFAAYYTAHAGEFFTGARIVSEEIPRQLNLMTAWLLRNETLADGANYTPK